MSLPALTLYFLPCRNTTSCSVCCEPGKYFLLPQSLNSRLESLERTVTSQQEVITAQQALLSRIDTAGGVQSYDLAQVQQRKNLSSR